MKKIIISLVFVAFTLRAAPLPPPPKLPLSSPELLAHAMIVGTEVTIQVSSSEFWDRRSVPIPPFVAGDSPQDRISRALGSPEVRMDIKAVDTNDTVYATATVATLIGSKMVTILQGQTSFKIAVKGDTLRIPPGSLEIAFDVVGTVPFQFPGAVAARLYTYKNGVRRVQELYVNDRTGTVFIDPSVRDTVGTLVVNRYINGISDIVEYEGVSGRSVQPLQTGRNFSASINRFSEVTTLTMSVATGVDEVPPLFYHLGKSSPSAPYFNFNDLRFEATIIDQKSETPSPLMYIAFLNMFKAGEIPTFIPVERDPHDYLFHFPASFPAQPFFFYFENDRRAPVSREGCPVGFTCN